MPSGQFTRINLSNLYPAFRIVVLEVIARCNARGARYVATRGSATWAEQHRLRLAFLNGEGGRAAPAGRSAHNYGIAIDFVRDGEPLTPEVEPRWDHPAYAILGEEAQSAGLVWGKSFGDAPHVQWPGYAASRQLYALAKLMIGLPAQEGWPIVWRMLEAERATQDWQKANPKLAESLEGLHWNDPAPKGALEWTGFQRATHPPT